MWRFYTVDNGFLLDWIGLDCCLTSFNMTRQLHLLLALMKAGVGAETFLLS